MYLILFLVGIVLAFAGAVGIRYAVPIEDIAGAALFISGVVVMVGGLILLGIAAALRTLGRIAERLEIQPLPVPAVAAVGHDDPPPRPARTAPPPVANTKRPSLLSWLSRASTAASAEQKPATPPPEKTPPAVDLAPLTRVQEEVTPGVAAPPPPPPSPPAPKPVAPPVRPPARPVTPPAVAPAPATAPAATAPESTVYKSGVIDGMAYTLFMDGSIEAELPHGRVRFGSVDELQKYLTSRP